MVSRRENSCGVNWSNSSCRSAACSRTESFCGAEDLRRSFSAAQAVPQGRRASRDSHLRPAPIPSLARPRNDVRIGLALKRNYLVHSSWFIATFRVPVQSNACHDARRKLHIQLTRRGRAEPWRRYLPLLQFQLRQRKSSARRSSRSIPRPSPSPKPARLLGFCNAARSPKISGRERLRPWLQKT